MLQHLSPLRTFGLGVTFAVAVLGTACSSGSGSQQAALEPAGSPDYRAGQSFTFSDRGTRRVVAVEGGGVRWSRKPGTSYLVSPNFIVPILRRESSSSVVSHQAFGSPEDLWPLRVGKSVRFRVVRTTLSKSDGRQTRTTYNWRCDVEDTDRVTVPAGTFDTYRIDCRRFFGHRQTPRRRITWYYAPELGHYVRREKEHLGTREIRTIELVSTTGRRGA